MQSMSYYQQGYQTSVPFTSTGAPTVSSALSASAPPPMMNPGSNLPPMQHHTLDNAGHPGGVHSAPIKRKQVKNACTNCQKACKKCADERPCPRCIKYNIADTCVNSVRKERKKGIKRGPYKKRQKSADSEKTVRKGDGLEGVDPQSQHVQGNQYMRSAAMPAFGYPSNLNQYGQQPYNPYGSYANYPKDQILPQSYVMNPLYPSMGYPVLVAGQGENGSTQSPHGYQHPPVSQQHYGLVQPHASQGSRPFDEHVLQQQGGNPPSMYYAAQHQTQQAQAQVQQQLQSTPVDKDEAMVKLQPTTPVPSASTSSGASSPPEAAEDEESTKFARLSELCSAALDYNKNVNPARTEESQQS